MRRNSVAVVMLLIARRWGRGGIRQCINVAWIWDAAWLSQFAHGSCATKAECQHFCKQKFIKSALSKHLKKKNALLILDCLSHLSCRGGGVGGLNPPPLFSFYLQRGTSGTAKVQTPGHFQWLDLVQHWSAVDCRLLERGQSSCGA